MKNPDWFLILREWKRQMGAVGVTLPFLYGALKLKSDEYNQTSKSAREIMNKIIMEPVDGYVTQVQQCEDISETVLSVVKLNDKKHRVVCKSYFTPVDGREKSLVFSSNFESKYGLKNADAAESLTQLLEDAESHIVKGEYSKLKIDVVEYEFGLLNEREIEFVKSTIFA